MWSRVGWRGILYSCLNSKESVKLRIELKNKERICSVLSSASQEERGAEFT